MAIRRAIVNRLRDHRLSDLGVGLIFSVALVTWVTFLYLRSQARSIERRQP